MNLHFTAGPLLLSLLGLALSHAVTHAPSHLYRAAKWVARKALLAVLVLFVGTVGLVTIGVAWAHQQASKSNTNFHLGKGQLILIGIALVVSHVLWHILKLAFVGVAAGTLVVLLAGSFYASGILWAKHQASNEAHHFQQQVVNRLHLPGSTPSPSSPSGTRR